MKVTLTRWRDAKTDPPDDARVVWTDRGDVYFNGGEWCKVVSVQHLVIKPQPSLWCDPVPPDEDDPLTEADLGKAIDALMSFGNYVSADRLRRALTDPPKKETP